MKKGLVSIVTPCYNGAKYIAETIESVLAQTYESRGRNAGKGGDA